MSINETNADVPQNKKQSRTLREELDCKIESARHRVEELCITKAKLEALNVLDHPSELYYNVAFL